VFASLALGVDAPGAWPLFLTPCTVFKRRNYLVMSTHVQWSNPRLYKLTSRRSCRQIRLA